MAGLKAMAQLANFVQLGIHPDEVTEMKAQGLGVVVGLVVSLCAYGEGTPGGKISVNYAASPQRAHQDCVQRLAMAVLKEKGFKRLVVTSPAFKGKYWLELERYDYSFSVLDTEGNFIGNGSLTAEFELGESKEIKPKHEAAFVEQLLSCKLVLWKDSVSFLVLDRDGKTFAIVEGPSTRKIKGLY